MKIQNNYTGLNFQRGLTKHIRNEINSCDTHKIADYLTKEKGIKADFKGNKLIAWCALKSVLIIEELNRCYNTRFTLPYAVYVEDFEKFNVDSNGTFGFLNFLTNNHTYKDGSLAMADTIYYNNFKNIDVNSPNGLWDKIDEIMDSQYENKMATTDFFLEPIFHEFVHAMHEGNLVKKLGIKGMFNFVKTQYLKENIAKFQCNHSYLLTEISDYATETPMESVACDFSKRAITNIDEKTLLPKINFIASSPYQRQGFMDRFLSKPLNKTDELLKSIWNGRYRTKS